MVKHTTQLTKCSTIANTNYTMHKYLFHTTFLSLDNLVYRFVSFFCVFPFIAPSNLTNPSTSHPFGAILFTQFRCISIHSSNQELGLHQMSFNIMFNLCINFGLSLGQNLYLCFSLNFNLCLMSCSFKEHILLSLLVCNFKFLVTGKLNLLVKARD